MSTLPIACEKLCKCDINTSHPKLVVITGGPGAGKTAILESLRKILCQHVIVLPEAASIIFGGGFWRLKSAEAAKASQRAIFHVQSELETIVHSEKIWAVGLCDRGTLDGMAYWTGSEQEYFSSFKTSLLEEYKRYHAVIHLRCPTENMGYNHQNPLRTETPEQAKIIDDRIAEIWSKHANYKTIPAYPDFSEKVREAYSLVVNLLPKCCQQNS